MSAFVDWFRQPRVALIAGLAFLLGGFALLADEVAEGDTTAFDQWVLMALRDPANPAQPLGPTWLHEAARDITSLGSFSVLFLFIAAVVLYFLAKRHARAAIFVVVTALVGTALSNTLKLLFHRARPDLPGLPAVFTASFPSGHAALSAVVYLTMGLLLAESEPDRRVKRLIMGAAIVLTLLVGLSRVYIGVHFPTDVLAGWCLGIAWALLCWTGLKRWRKEPAA